MRAGDHFDAPGQKRIDEACARAFDMSGLDFEVRLAEEDQVGRPAAVAVHRELPEKAYTVLTYVDLFRREVHIVTGVEAGRTLSDAQCRLAAESMVTNFAADNIVGGVVGGVLQMGHAARAPKNLHVRRPVLD